MKRLTVLVVFAIGAAAQPARVNSALPVSVMGKAIKGAPYAADEITESVQVLSDGTRISNQNQVTVYRDGEGRVRRESPTQITIWDPVANLSYTLDPKAMTAVKSSMARAMYNFVGPGDYNTVKFYFSASGSTSAGDLKAILASEQAMAVALDKLKAETASAGVPADKAQLASESQAMAMALDKLKAETEMRNMMVNGTTANPQAEASMKEQLNAVRQKLAKINGTAPSKSEPLGQQVIQGLTADGTRETSTIEAGAIGNDRPINVVSERWYSNELQTAVLTTRTDPRTGEETFRLTNVRRGEPGADLFMLPPGYQLLDSPANKMLLMPSKKEE